MIFQSFTHVLSKCYPNLSLRTSDPMAQANEILKRVGLEREPFTPKIANIYSWHKPDFHNLIEFLVLTKPLRISGVTWCHTNQHLHLLPSGPWISLQPLASGKGIDRSFIRFLHELWSAYILERFQGIPRPKGGKLWTLMTCDDWSDKCWYLIESAWSFPVPCGFSAVNWLAITTNRVDLDYNSRRP